MDDVKCPYCKKEVELQLFGDGWIGICCNKVVYNESNRSTDVSRNCKNDKIRQTDTYKQS